MWIAAWYQSNQCSRMGSCKLTRSYSLHSALVNTLVLSSMLFGRLVTADTDVVCANSSRVLTLRGELYCLKQDTLEICFIQILGPDTHDYWDLDVSPEQTHENLLVGASVGPRVVRINVTSSLQGSDDLWKPPKHEYGRSDCLTVKWLSPLLFMAGHRNGLVSLYDLRARSSVKRVMHGTTISSMKRVDNVRVLLHGPKRLAMYDLRYTPVPSGYQHVSAPWLEYDQSKTPSVGSNGSLDISSRLGLLATGLQRGGFQLLDLWSGKHVPSNLDHMTTEEKACFVSFAGGNKAANSLAEDEAPTGLLLGTPNIVQEWSAE